MRHCFAERKRKCEANPYQEKGGENDREIGTSRRGVGMTRDYRSPNPPPAQYLSVWRLKKRKKGENRKAL